MHPSHVREYFIPHLIDYVLIERGNDNQSGYILQLFASFQVGSDNEFHGLSWQLREGGKSCVVGCTKNCNAERTRGCHIDSGRGLRYGGLELFNDKNPYA